MVGLFSPSAVSLFAINLGVIGFAVKDNWSLPTILASYLLQSVIIGIFQAIKMADLNEFSTAGLTINYRPSGPRRQRSGPGGRATSSRAFLSSTSRRTANS